MAKQLTFDEFYSIHSKRILGLINICKRKYPRQLHEDLDSVSMYWAWKCYENWDESRCNYFTYLGNTLRFRFVDHMRNTFGRNKPRPRLISLEAPDQPVNHYNEGEYQENSLKRSLKAPEEEDLELPKAYYTGLNFQEKQLVYYHFERRMTLAEIGKVLDLSESRCSQIFTSVKDILKRKLCSRENAATLADQSVTQRMIGVAS